MRQVLIGVSALLLVLALIPPAIVQAAAARVTLNGELLFEISSAFFAYSAEDRAATINKRLLQLADDPSIPVSSIVVVETDLSSDIVANGEPLHSVLEADAQAAGTTRQALARSRADIIKRAVAQYRSDHRVVRIATGVALAIAAIVAFVLLVRVTGRVRPLLAARLARAGHTKRLSKLEEAVERASGKIIDVVRFAVLATALFFCLQVALRGLPWTRPYAAGLLDLVLNPLKTLGAGVLRHLPGLAFIAVVAVLCHYVLRALAYLFERLGAGAMEIEGFYPEWAKPTFNIVRVLVICFAAVVAYPYVPGSDSLAFKGVSVFLGVLVSVGSSGAVGNAFAGLTLTYMRAFHVDDVVRIGEITGTVTEASLLATRIRTAKNVDVTIPNSLVQAGPVTNFSALARGGLVLHTKVSIGYGTPWRQVHALLLLAADRTEGLLKTPPPFVHQTLLDDFYVVYELNVYTDTPGRQLHLYSALHANVQDTFNEYGVQILSPHYEDDPRVPAVVPPQHWHDAPAGGRHRIDVVQHAETA